MKFVCPSLKFSAFRRNSPYSFVNRIYPFSQTFWLPEHQYWLFSLFKKFCSENLVDKICFNGKRRPNRFWFWNALLLLLINHFQSRAPIWYSRKMSENHRLSDFFRKYKKGSIGLQSLSSFRNWAIALQINWLVSIWWQLWLSMS